MVLSVLLLRARGSVLPSDCVEEEELLRLRTVWLDIVGVVVVGVWFDVVVGFEMCVLMIAIWTWKCFFALKEVMTWYIDLDMIFISSEGGTTALK